jgi:hypothetical protein
MRERTLSGQPSRIHRQDPTNPRVLYAATPDNGVYTFTRAER